MTEIIWHLSFSTSSAHFLIGLFVLGLLRHSVLPNSLVMSSLYILDVNPLLDKSFTNIFSHNVGCLLVLLMVSFAVQNLFSWYSPTCSLLILFPLPEEMCSGKSCSCLYSRDFFLCFLFCEFYAVMMYVQAFVPFPVYFCVGVRQWSSFILLHVAVQFCQYQLLNRLSFPHCIFMTPLLYINWPYMLGFISGLSSLFHWSIILFCASTKLSWLLWLCSRAWSWGT